jgi:hypothetical protein
MSPLNREAGKQVDAMFSTALPDLKQTVDEMIAEGNTVAISESWLTLDNLELLQQLGAIAQPSQV